MISVPLGAADRAVDAMAGVAVSARVAAGTASRASDLRIDMGSPFPSHCLACCFAALRGRSPPGKAAIPLTSRLMRPERHKRRLGAFRNRYGSALVALASAIITIRAWLLRAYISSPAVRS